MKKIFIVFMALSTMLCTSCNTREVITYNYDENQKPRQYAFHALDTECSISMWGVEKDDSAEDYYYSMKSLIDEYDNVFSKTNIQSEIYEINHRAGNDVIVSEEVAKLFMLAKEFYNWSNGKFDISAGTLFNLWDVKNRKALPSKSEIDEALKHTANFDYTIEYLTGDSEGMAKITFNGDRETQYDLGALVKGYCSDTLKEMLSNNKDIDACIVNLGGNVLTSGIVAGRKDGFFKVGIFKPFATSNEIIDIVEVKNRCVITSGTYQRYFKVDGDNRVYHHIIDPTTGYPTNNGLDSVTIVSENGLLGDYLSTSCMLLGESDAKKLIDFANSSTVFGDKNIQAIFVRTDGTIAKYPEKVNIK